MHKLPVKKTLKLYFILRLREISKIRRNYMLYSDYVTLFLDFQHHAQ
jgi:hypothetical protein